MTYNTMTMHSAATADANGPSLDCEGYSILGVQITGTFTATVYFEGTVDESTWVLLEAINVATGAKATSATAAGVYRMGVAGLVQARARLDWTSGTSITVTARLSDAPDPMLQDVVLSAGSAAIGKLAANSGVDIGDVDVTSISAGETHIGQVGSPGTTIALTPAVTAGIYTAGDAVGGLLTFTNAARVSAGGGVIKNVLLVDDAGQDAEIELWLFNQTFTAMTNNDAWEPSEANLENWIGTISTQDSAQGWLAAGTPSTCTIEVAMRYDLTGTSLFGQLVTRGTPAFAATDDVTVKVALLQD